MIRSIPAARVGCVFAVLLFGTIDAAQAQHDGEAMKDRPPPQDRSVGSSDRMREKISASLQESFRFDPAVAPVDMPNEEVVRMEPVEVTEQALSRKLEVAVEQERLKLTPIFNFREGGEFVKDAFGRMTVEAKPYQDVISPDLRNEPILPRWSLLRIKW